MLVPLLIAAAQAADAAEPEIVITASRLPEDQAHTPVSVSLIDSQRIERLGEPLVPALIRLTPSAAVESGGPAGSLAQVRIRGAEANHTLLFIDGIRANDPAAGDIPRFELLNADIVSRIEVVRGPQSALWGSDAIGGVVGENLRKVKDWLPKAREILTVKCDVPLPMEVEDLAFGTRTVVMVTHRPAVLDLAQRVIVVDGGKVVLDGPKPQVLAALSGAKPAATATPESTTSPNVHLHPSTQPVQRQASV